MIQQAAVAIQAAMLQQPPTTVGQNDNNVLINRQTIRLALSESMYRTKEESFVADRAVGWQGGPRETYRYLLPLVEQLLRQVSTTQDNTSGLTAKVQAQVLLDFDGSALVNGMSPMGPKRDSLALLQPNTDKYYINLLQQMEETFSDTPGKDKRLFLVINPAWKSASSFGFFQTKQAQTQILDRYPVTYALDQFIIKSNKVSLLKCWPHDWCVYWTPLPQPGSKNAVAESQLLGHFEHRPEYTVVEKLLLQAITSR